MYRNLDRSGAGPRRALLDHGPFPYAANVNEAARQNCAFRSAFWTGRHLQMTLMRIPAGGDIGPEVHPDTDQYIRVEEGRGLALLGCCKERLDTRRSLGQNDALFVPAGTWHNIVNPGCTALHLSSVYAPPHHPRGTLHETKEDAEAD